VTVVRHASTSIQLIKVLDQAARLKPQRRALTSNTLDLQRQGFSALKRTSNECNNTPCSQFLAGMEVEVCAVLKFQEFNADEENAIGLIGLPR